MKKEREGEGQWTRRPRTQGWRREWEWAHRTKGEKGKKEEKEEGEGEEGREGCRGRNDQTGFDHLDQDALSL